MLSFFLEDNSIIRRTQSDFKYKAFFSEKKIQSCNININLTKFDAALAFMEQLENFMAVIVPHVQKEFSNPLFPLSPYIFLHTDTHTYW